MKSNEYSFHKNEPIAVIGMSCIYPEAKDVKDFWQNILNGVDAIGDPTDSWEAERYIKSGRIKTAKGGYLKDLFRFNPLEFGIMPNSVDGGEPDQLLALQVAKRALEDAGEKYTADDYNHRDTGIILGHSSYYHRGQINLAQHSVCIDQTLDILKAALPDMTGEQSQKVRDILIKQLPQFNVDMCPSEVPNVMTGRIANRLNFTGPNYILDAACSSSLLAVNSAIDELRSGKSRMMLAGGVNASLPAEVAVIFTFLDALSSNGRVRPFEEGSAGTLLGEGIGIVALKKLSDAMEDGDKIYALVHGVGQSSDGKGLGLLAPSEHGEALAISRTYEQTGINPDSISLVEAHGTGISLGDKTEISSLKSIFGGRKGEQGRIALGSVKSMISHTIPAAGMASFIKMCMALHHKVLPQTLCDKVNPDLGIEQTALYVNNKIKPWINKTGEPLRAAINSFGFGGVNSHAILEEAPIDAKKPLKYSPRSSEIFVFADDNINGLKSQLAELEKFIAKRGDCKIEDIAFSLCDRIKKNSGQCRLALIASDLADLQKKIEQANKRLEKSSEPLLGKGGVVFSNAPVAGKLAFLFPGEGSQYMNMLSDLATHFEPVRKWFSIWNSTYDETPGSARIDALFPANSELTSERKEALIAKLNTMDIGSESVFIAGQAMNSLLEYLGVKADVMMGHSSGESSALAASGAMSWGNAEEVSGLIRQLNNISSEIAAKGGVATGSLMAIGLMARDKIAQEIAGKEIDIAMENCPTQTIVFGSKDDIKQLSAKLSEKGAICEILPFDRGYHTPAFMPMQKGFAKFYEDIKLQAPKLPLYSCASAGLFSGDDKETRELAAKQWSNTVRFVDTVNAMYDDGVRYFVEVGPSGKLTSFTEQVLRFGKKDKNCVVAASNVVSQPGLDQLLNLMAKLYVNGKAGVEKLFDERDVNILDFSQLTAAKPKGMVLDNTIPRLYATDELKNVLGEIAPVRANEFMQSSNALNDNIDEYRQFISEITELSDTNFVGKSYLNVCEDIFLQDHVLSGAVSDINPDLYGLSCVPMMVTLEIMAEAAAMIAKSINLTVIENVQTFDWVALDNGEITLDVRANSTAKENCYEAEVFNGDVRVMRATFIFEDKKFVCPPLHDLHENRAFDAHPNENELYTIGMYHGPIFQTIPTVQAWDDSGIDANISHVSLVDFFRIGETPKLILNPALLDAANQLPAFRDVQLIGVNFYSFPTKIERIELYAQCPADIEGVTLKTRKRASSTESMRVWDFDCIDNQGNSLLRISGMNDVFFPVPKNFRQCLHVPLEGWMGESTEQGWKVKYLPEEFCAQSKNIFLRMLAHCMLSESQHEQWRSLQNADLKEKIDWLFSIICIKESVRNFIYQQTGELLYPSDIEISYDNQSQIYAYGWWCEEENHLINELLVFIRLGSKEIFANCEIYNQIEESA